MKADGVFESLVVEDSGVQKTGQHGFCCCAFGGAAASVGMVKQRRIVFAAQHWLMRQSTLPPCRFDVVALDGERLQWLKAAFDSG